MTRRDCGARLLAGAIVLTSSLTSASVAGATSTHTHHASHAHDDSYDSLYYDSGYSADYGGVTIGSGTDFYYDPGSSCDASICNSAFYDPSTNFYYDPSGQTSIDSAGAFDNYITEGGNPDTISARAGSGRDALKTLGHELGTLSTSTAAPARAAQAPQTGMQAMTLPGGLARAITQTGGAHRPVSAWVGTARQPALVAGLIHAATTPRLRPATAVGAKAAIFVDTPRTYKLTYPSVWPLITHNAYVKGAFVDMRIVAPDANAGVAAQSATLPQGMAFSLSNPAVQQYFYNAIGASLSAFGAQVTQQMQIQVSQTGGGDEVLVGRVPFQWVDTSLAPDVFTHIDNGTSGALLWVVLRNNNRLYDITGTIADTAAASAQADATQTTAILSSLDLLHTYSPTGPVQAVVDATHTYGVAYPTSSWSRLPATQAGALAVRSADRTAGVAGVSWAAPKGMSQLTTGYMQQVVGALGSSLGTIKGKPAFRHVTYKNVPRYTATLSFRRADGKTGKAVVVVSLHHARVNTVAGITMDAHTKSPKGQGGAAQVSFIVSSLHLM